MIRILPLFAILTLNGFAHASMSRDTSLDHSLVSCTTEGVAPFRRHDGGFQFRLDEVPGLKSVGRAQFWAIQPILADSLIKRSLGAENLNLVPEARSGGRCAILLNQVNDVDGNQIDVRVDINREDPARSRGVIDMILDGERIDPRQGRLTCVIDPGFAEFYAARHCDRRVDDSTRAPGEGGAGAAR